MVLGLGEFSSFLLAMVLASVCLNFKLYWAAVANAAFLIFFLAYCFFSVYLAYVGSLLWFVFNWFEIITYSCGCCRLNLDSCFEEEYVSELKEDDYKPFEDQEN